MEPRKDLASEETVAAVNVFAWEVQSYLGRVHIHVGHSIVEAVAIYADHFKLSVEAVAGLITNGSLVVWDEINGKQIAGSQLAHVLGEGGATVPDSKPVEDNPQLADASVGGLGTGVSE